MNASMMQTGETLYKYFLACCFRFDGLTICVRTTELTVPAIETEFSAMSAKPPKGALVIVDTFSTPAPEIKKLRRENQYAIA
ncbi:MAG: hypothetical protein WCI51_18290 [Lentisphaerota bacterium]